MKVSSKKFGFLCLAVLAVLAMVITPAPAQASTLDFNVNFLFAGNTPGSSSPYATAQFRDGTDCDPDCGAGQVQLVLTSSLEAASEFIGEWYFNINPDITSFSITDGAGPNASFSSGTNTPVAGVLTISQNANQNKADGDGLYDFVLNFAANDLNGVGETAVFVLSATGLDVTDFNFLSSQSNPAGPAGPFHTVIHIQGIQPNCSGWASDTVAGSSAGQLDGPCGGTTVPEPSTLLLLGSGLASLGLWGRKKFMSR